MRWTHRVTNHLEAERLLAGWAGMLGARFDELHGKNEE